jgi:hypothetical protein
MTHAGPRSWQPEPIDLANHADLNAFAARLCVTPNELREIIEEMGERDFHRTPDLGASE